MRRRVVTHKSTNQTEMLVEGKHVSGVHSAYADTSLNGAA